MEKQKIVGKRCCLSRDMRLDEGVILHKGATGKIFNTTSNPHFVAVAFDGVYDLDLDDYNGFVYCALSELYFPDDKNGYNQKCFK